MDRERINYSTVMESTPTRIERDSLGSVEVPADALYGAHTVRAIANFAVSGVTMRERPVLIAALGAVKAAAARANAACGALPADIAEALVTAAREVAAGRHDAEFPIDVVHGGGGTAVNMNANEVVANRAGELLGGARGTYDRVHPNDHANRSQSTNDVYPTALALAVAQTGRGTAERLDALVAALRAQATRHPGVQRLGRTCLQDAVPMTIEETHLAQARAVERTAAALRRALDELLAVPLGATAIGTGIGAADGYAERVIGFLAEETGLPVRPAPDLFDALANLDGHIDVAAQLVRTAHVVAKIGADLRLLSSGPHGGIAEVRLPAVQVGSSIMPGKVNPAIPELVMQLAVEARGTLAIVEGAVALGELELNVFEPLIARHLLASLHDVGVGATLLAERCVAGLEWDLERVAAHVAHSLAGAVEDASRDGYVAAASARKRDQPT